MSASASASAIPTLHHNPNANPDPDPPWVHLSELLEQVGQGRGVDPDPGVRDLDDHVFFDAVVADDGVVTDVIHPQVSTRSRGWKGVG